MIEYTTATINSVFDHFLEQRGRIHIFIKIAGQFHSQTEKNAVEWNAVNLEIKV